MYKRQVLADEWTEAVLIMDADVIFARDSLRKMSRHLADEKVGAVTAYIAEGSRDRNYLTRFIAIEYVMDSSRPGAPRTSGERSRAWPAARSCIRGRTSKPSAVGSRPARSPKTR